MFSPVHDTDLEALSFECKDQLPTHQISVHVLVAQGLDPL